MSLRSSATRYAKVLFEVAVRESDPVRIERDLTSIMDVISQHADLRRAMTSPGIPGSARVGVVRALVDKMGVEPPVAKLLVLLAERGRLELLPDLVDVYREHVLAHSNVVRASVTAAVPLTPDKVRTLENSIAGLTGKHVQLDVRTDPSLIGGVVARIGGTVYDGSVRTQLEKMKKQLVENA